MLALLSALERGTSRVSAPLADHYLFEATRHPEPA
jgi:hypothetical protein